ncbi:UNVERIFIED_CONTAM: hypothetical protein FKN15_052486 [Acipenser sinensis]
MPASQMGFGDFFIGKNINMPHGYHTMFLGCPPGVPPVPGHPAVAGAPLSYPGMQGYSFIPYLHLGHNMRQMSPYQLKSASPYHQALLGQGAPFYSPYRAVAAEDPGRAGKAAARESTGALKAWLSEHLKNPYPTKGEKVMLAIVTKMSLTQVSTWFANARRRLKKENKVSWVCKNKSDEERESEEEEAGEKSKRAEEEKEEEDIDLQTVDDNEEEGSGSYHQALLGQGAPFYSPYRAVAAEDPGRAGKAAARESTGALKAWLSEHLKNPYPTKGEKVMLAIVTKMSLTQVSTWFANARRRLKKENKVSWVCKNKSDEESESEEEEAGEKSERAEEEEEEDIDLQTVDDNEEEGSGSDGSDQESTRTPDRLSPAAPGDRLKESERETENKGVPRLGDDTKPELGAKENTQPQKHQIWSLVETATSGTGHSAVQKRRVHHIKSQDTGGLRADLAVRNGQYFPVYLPAHYTHRHGLSCGIRK